MCLSWFGKTGCLVQWSDKIVDIKQKQTLAGQRHWNHLFNLAGMQNMVHSVYTGPEGTQQGV